MDALNVSVHACDAFIFVYGADDSLLFFWGAAPVYVLALPPFMLVSLPLMLPTLPLRGGGADAVCVESSVREPADARPQLQPYRPGTSYALWPTECFGTVAMFLVLSVEWL